MGELIVKILIGAVVIGCIIWAIWFENRPDDKSDKSDKDKNNNK